MPKSVIESAFFPTAVRALKGEPVSSSLKTGGTVGHLSFYFCDGVLGLARLVLVGLVRLCGRVHIYRTAVVEKRRRAVDAAYLAASSGKSASASETVAASRIFSH